MAEKSLNWGDTDPLIIVERPDDPQTDPVQLEYTAYPTADKIDSEVDLSHNRWIADLADEHVNPRWDERFEVITGEWRVTFEGTETTLTEGDDIVLPADVPHRHWNPGDRPARIRFEVRPGLQFAEAVETMYTLAQVGRTNEDGMPNLLQFAVIQDAYPGYFYSTDLPRSVQRTMFKVLAPIGRLMGYRATYSRDEIKDLR